MEKINATKILIGDTFKRLASTINMRKISVQDILEECKINRATFYYYFATKQDVVTWVFRWEFSQELKGAFPLCELISYSWLSGDPHDGLPFYVKQNINARDDSRLMEFWNLLTTYLGKNAAFYSNAFWNISYDDLGYYMFNLYQKQVEKELLHDLNGSFLPDYVLERISIFITNSLLGMLIAQLKGNIVPHGIASSDTRIIELYHKTRESILNYYLEGSNF